MKRNILTSFALAGVFLLSACEESSDPGVSKEDLAQQVLDRIEKNEGISYNMFSLLSTRLPADSLRELKAGASTQASFINVIARQTDDFFFEVVEAGVSEFNVTTIPTPFAGVAEVTLRDLAGIATEPGAAPFDLPGAYSKKLTSLIEEQANKDRHKDWIIIDSHSETTAPQETLSLNFDKITFLAQVPHTIIMDLGLTDDQVIVKLNEVLNANQIPSAAIGLLLPAVQKVRDLHPTNDEPFKDAMNSWLDGPVAQNINGGLNRDIIRRIQASVYLAALHTIILDEYDGQNTDMASLSVLHARYRAAIIVGSKELWTE